MQSRITLELENKENYKVKLLNLDNCVSSSIEGLTSEFCNLVKLSMNNVGLTSIENLPELESLKKLELADNKISGGLKFLKSCPKLKKIDLSSNEIKNFNELKPLRKLRKLKVLDLYNNDVQLIRNYREKVFYLIPSLKFLDGFDKYDQECPSDNDEGLAYSEEEDDLTSNGEGDMDHEEEKSWDYDYFDDLPEERKREIMKKNSNSDSSSDSNSDNSDQDSSSSSSSSSSQGSAHHSDSSWEDVSLDANSCDNNSTKDNDTSKEEDWVDISSELSD